jgi:anti-sigma regulatory factor (Ser/Thr protein kinase)
LLMNAAMTECELRHDAFRWESLGAFADLAELRLRLRIYLAQRAVPAADLAAIVLGLQEASKNALRASAGDAVTVAVWIEDEVIYACVSDQGSGLARGTPHDCPSPWQTHGRGLYLMRCLMDGVEIDCSAGTKVWMQRRLARRLSA